MNEIIVKQIDFWGGGRRKDPQKGSPVTASLSELYLCTCFLFILSLVFIDIKATFPQVIGIDGEHKSPWARIETNSTPWERLQSSLQCVITSQLCYGLTPVSLVKTMVLNESFDISLITSFYNTILRGLYSCTCFLKLPLSLSVYTYNL